MGKELPLFDYEEGLRRKDEGKDLAAHNRSELLAIARATAYEIGADGSVVDMDMVRELMQERGQYHEGLGNAAGSVFKPENKMPVWEFVEFVNSRRPVRHTNPIRRWKRRDR